MAHKIVGYYNDAQKAAITEADQLYIEIGNNELACLVKGAESQETEGFEVFQLDKGQSDWTDVFYEVRSTSQLLNRTYKDVHCRYNFEEAVIIPEPKFTLTSAEDYLSLLYGESNRYDIKYDSILPVNHMVNAYRIRKSINELMCRHFVLYKPSHIYSGILNDLLTRIELANHFIKVQFYSTHIVVAVVKHKQLQLIQSFQYEVSEDILYHLVNISQQFELDNTVSNLEMSGMFETGSLLHQQLQPLFGLITFETVETSGVCKSVTGFAAHYFTPFYKLVV